MIRDISEDVVADGEAYVSYQQTGAWEKILQLATSYHLTTPTIVAFLWHIRFHVATHQIGHE